MFVVRDFDCVQCTLYCTTFFQKSQIWSRIEQYKHIYLEPKNKNEFQTAMTNFYDKINNVKYNGAVFAAVCRGKVSMEMIPNPYLCQLFYEIPQ